MPPRIHRLPLLLCLLALSACATLPKPCTGGFVAINPPGAAP